QFRSESRGVGVLLSVSGETSLIEFDFRLVLGKRDFIVTIDANVVAYGQIRKSLEALPIIRTSHDRMNEAALDLIGVPRRHAFGGLHAAPIETGDGGHASPSPDRNRLVKGHKALWRRSLIQRGRRQRNERKHAAGRQDQSASSRALSDPRCISEDQAL